MSNWDVAAVGAGTNAHAASFHGAALKIARTLELPSEFIDQIMKQHKELTSPFPLVGDLGLSSSIQAGVNVAEASAAQVPNSGRGGISLA